jgi:hypothetical protein
MIFGRAAEPKAFRAELVRWSFPSFVWHYFPFCLTSRWHYHTDSWS